MSILKEFLHEMFHDEIKFIDGLHPIYERIKNFILETDDPKKIYDSWKKIKNVLDNAIRVIYLHKEDYIDDMETWEGTLRDFQSLKRKHAEKVIQARDHLLAQGYEL